MKIYIITRWFNDGWEEGLASSDISIESIFIDKDKAINKLKSFGNAEFGNRGEEIGWVDNSIYGVKDVYSLEERETEDSL